MFQSTNPLSSSEQGGSRSGYQSIETGGAISRPVDDAPPPTFLSQVKEAKENSQGYCEFCKMFFGILIGSCVWLLVLVITFTLPFVMIILGSVFFHQCPIQPMIPIFNLVAGLIVLLNNIINTIGRVRGPNNMSETGTKAIGWVTVILNIILLGWFVTGCYWVYSVYPHVNIGNCATPLYSFTFWMLNACFIFLFTMILTACIMMCMALVCF